MWNGDEYISWARPVAVDVGFRDMGHGIYESPGSATIRNTPGSGIAYFDWVLYGVFDSQNLNNTILNQEPQIKQNTSDRVVIETLRNKFEFSKRNGTLLQLVYFSYPKNGQKTVWKTYTLSNHIECNGVWIPLQIALDEQVGSDKTFKMKIFVDPKTVRVLDAVNASAFCTVLPTGCMVNDAIRKTEYMVTTLDTTLNDVDTIQKMLDQMLEQAEEQKAAVEREMKEKK
jgi:hypothetical protein